MSDSAKTGAKAGGNVKMTLIALMVVILWGLTFVSFSVAGNYFTPAQIMFLRVLIAYISLWAVYPHYHRSEGWKTELLLFFAGLTGTTMYVMLTNYALDYIDTSIVSVLSSLSPLFTALLMPLFFRGSKISGRVIIGFVVALVGATLVTTGGKLDFAGGDFGSFALVGAVLAIASAVAWACYTLILRHLGSSEYPQIYITRRLFLYGLICVIPFLIFFDTPLVWSNLLIPEALLNMLYLGLIAYTFCHVGWGTVTRVKGGVWASQFTYITPIATMVGSAIILGDTITLVMIVGTVFILAGVAYADGTLIDKLIGRNKQDATPADGASADADDKLLADAAAAACVDFANVADAIDEKTAVEEGRQQ